MKKKHDSVQAQLDRMSAVKKMRKEMPWLEQQIEEFNAKAREQQDQKNVNDEQPHEEPEPVVEQVKFNNEGNEPYQDPDREEEVLMADDEITDREFLGCVGMTVFGLMLVAAGIYTVVSWIISLF